jgi:hypothetical protein
MAAVARLTKDPPSLKPMRVRPIFDSRPHRNRYQPGIAQEMKWPNDRLLIATLVVHGQPQWSAEQIRHHPPARLHAAMFWLDVWDAAEGDKQAAERVDYCRWCWQEMRKQEVISDIPNRTVGFFER